MSAFTGSDGDMFSRFGISPELVLAAKIQRVTDDEARALGLRFDGDLSGLFFPYHLPSSSSYVSGRVRRDNPETEDGKPKNKYINIPGRHHLYLPPGAAELLADRTVPVIFVEAEKSALAITAFAARRKERILAVATGGVWGWHGTIGKTTSADGERVDEKGPLPDLDLFRGHPILVLFDSNVAARMDLRNARSAFSKALTERSCAVRLLDLPTVEGVNGPDDFLAVSGDDAFALVLDPTANWREMFHTFKDFDDAPPLSFAAEGFLQHDAVTGIAGLSGHSKTFVGLSISKALLFGPCVLWDLFRVPVRAERVVYLIPESTITPFKHRLKLMGLYDEIRTGRLLVRTLSKGPTPRLDDPALLRAARGAYVLTDTAIRFIIGDESNASEMARGLSLELLALSNVARAVLALFHSQKNFGKEAEMTLENMIRGSGELGAMLATAWGIKQIDRTTNTVHVQNIKPRDFEPCGPFQLIGRPYIDRTGDFALLKKPEDCGSLAEEQPELRKGGGASEKAREAKAANIALLENWLEKNPDLSTEELREKFKSSGVKVTDEAVRKYKSDLKKMRSK